MKKFLLLGLLVLATVVAVGFRGPQYDIGYVPVKVASGDTLWEIADAWYMESHAPMCFEAFVHEIKYTKANEKVFAKGRYLQPGDVVLVPVFAERVEKHDSKAVRNFKAFCIPVKNACY